MENPQNLAFVLALACLIAAASVAAKRLQLASPIVLLLAGAAVGFVPGLPRVPLDPDVALMILLPPILYGSGVGMSWRGFRANLRPILLLAVGCVLFTTTAVAVVVHYAVGLPWAVAFVLGAIVSPPDAVAPMAMLRALRLPRRLILALEGESLVNDATALVTFSFALAAVVSGSFSAATAALQFTAIASSEILFGLAIGWATLWVRRLADDPRAEVLLALVTPFAAFWPPHLLGGSGVVACVTAGLWVSWNGRHLIRPATRLQGYFIWDLVTWGVEALTFVLTGLQAHSVVEGLAGEGWQRPLMAAALVCVTVIAVRFVWVFPATYVPHMLSRALRRREQAPNWRSPFLLSFVGLRGVVSLAAALSIPFMVGDRAFPDRDLILFVTFCVIAFTLLGLGGTLPGVVRGLGLGRDGLAEAEDNKRAELAARLAGIDAVLAGLDRAASEGAPKTSVAALRRRHNDRRRHLGVSADERTDEDPVADTSILELKLVDIEREAIDGAYTEGRLTDEARRRIEREFDLEEARIRHAAASAAPAVDELAVSDEGEKETSTQSP
ncbi:Na+/H+ antiporter [Reyranella soli]|uniref:Na+/H+ antiporter n=1 Tax=Reyranella soli TaxID=1230389 RepID=A0A512NNL5_9HYPH|nr:Na+/H+ antiporter [Reyranella soli]GEP60547.1 Na+/H+ antiporter [Reyranella soli]